MRKNNIVPCWHCFLARNQILCFTDFFKSEKKFLLHKVSQRDIIEAVKYIPVGTWSLSAVKSG